MRGHVGDRLVLEPIHPGTHERVGVISAVRGADGGPPYLVRWLDTGTEALVFPGPDARVEPPHAPATRHG
jgi:hypothetical protein